VIKLDRSLKVERSILFFAFRYALGRSSYAPNTVVDNIKANIKGISVGDIKAYIKEINECENYGMDMDKRHWMNFRDYLINELKQR
jgi:hypothetical protein